MENLLITTICQTDNNAFNELAKLASKHECHINFSHLFSLGSDRTVTLQITGNWSGVAKIEAALPTLAKRLAVDLVFKRTHQEKTEGYFLPYNIRIVAINQPNIVYEITEFFSLLEIHIQHLKLRSSMHQETPIIKVNIHIDIPADSYIPDIREQFFLFCDELNLDGTLEPA